MTDGKPIPVEAAAEIGRTYGKNAVVIVAYEPSTGLTHCATWGDGPETRVVAARAGDECVRLMTGAGREETPGTQWYEDFRQGWDSRHQKAFDDAVNAEVERRAQEASA